jgi:hypothetical protein
MRVAIASVMSGFGVRARVDEFTAGNMPEKRLSRTSRSLIQQWAARIAFSSS